MATAPLSKLDDYQLVNKAQDIRGWQVQDPAGRRIGTVAELMVDTDAERVATIVVDSGESYPVEDISLGDHVVLLGYDLAPGAAAARQVADRTGELAPDQAGEAELRLQVLEERLRIGKREVERGGVRVSTHVEERPVEQQVQLREEQVTVERRPADRPVTAADARAAGAGTFEVTERAEEAVVAKQARVVEEVVVRKEVEERSETVRDTLRRTDVEVEQLDAEAPPRRR